MAAILILSVVGYFLTVDWYSQFLFPYFRVESEDTMEFCAIEGTIWSSGELCRNTLIFQVEKGNYVCIFMSLLNYLVICELLSLKINETN